jgi:nitrogen fixation protein NifB
LDNRIIARRRPRPRAARLLPLHPCMDPAAHERIARLHLPVAPKCNIRCCYCRRRVSPHLREACPGVAAAILSPQQAARKADDFLRRWGAQSIIGIAGPGDPLANPQTVETLAIIRARHPDARFCLCTNGLALPDCIEALYELGVAHLSVTINAAEAEIAARIHPWIRHDGGTLRGPDAAQVLVSRQLAGVATAVEHGMYVKVNTVVIPGVNTAHVADVARRTAELGARIINLIPLIPRGGLVGLPPPRDCQMKSLREECRRHLPVFDRCQRCRADAEGIPGRTVAI